MCDNLRCNTFLSRSGEIGRRTGLKIPRGKTRAGSIPASGTILKTAQQLVVRFFFLNLFTRRFLFESFDFLISPARLNSFKS